MRCGGYTAWGIPQRSDARQIFTILRILAPPAPTSYTMRSLSPPVLLLFVCAGLVGCGPDAAPVPQAEPVEDPMIRLPDDVAGEVVRRGIEAAGGWEAWADAPALDYQKTIAFFDSTGAETRRLTQHHRYALHPGPKMHIAYTDDEGRDVLLVNDGAEAWKWIDGERATAEEDRNQAWNSTFGSHYVMAMPFKLTDPGTRLSYAGRDTLDGVTVDAVRAEYDEGAGSAAGLHTWTYYFAVDDGRLVANHLRYGPEADDYDFTEYHDIREVDGVRLPMRRVSYHSNAAVERLGRASTYENTDVSLGALPDSLFRLHR